MDRSNQLIIVRGGGDIATGTIYTLHKCGYPVLVLETEHPSAIRRAVSFCEAVYEGSCQVEGVVCRRAEDIREARAVLSRGEIPVLVDEQCRILEEVQPWALIDAILAKRNLGTHRGMAKRTIGLGPGFTAGEDVDVVIETMRGHDLGRIIEQGSARANTGVPGVVGGYGIERVIRAPRKGRFVSMAKIGDYVEKGQVIARVVGEEGETEVHSSLTGLLRGILRSGYPVTEGFKIADVDPRRDQYENCFTISDKARNIGGAVLTALLMMESRE